MTRFGIGASVRRPVGSQKRRDPFVRRVYAIDFKIISNHTIHVEKQHHLTFRERTPVSLLQEAAFVFAEAYGAAGEVHDDHDQ